MKLDLPKYKTSDEVDFVVIGSGAAGGILAKELSTNGFRVVVLEQGPYLTESDFVRFFALAGRLPSSLTPVALGGQP